MKTNNKYFKLVIKPTNEELGYGFQIAPIRQILSLRLSPVSQLLLLNFFSHSYEKYPLSINRIRKSFGITKNRDSVNKALKELRDMGYLIITERTYKVNMNKINAEYKMFIANPDNFDDEVDDYPTEGVAFDHSPQLLEATTPSSQEPLPPVAKDDYPQSLEATTPSSYKLLQPVAPDIPYKGTIKEINKGIFRNENENGIGINEEAIKETAQPNLPTEEPTEEPTENIPNNSYKTLLGDTPTEFVPKYFHPKGISNILNSYSQYQESNSFRESQLPIFQFEEVLVLKYVLKLQEAGRDIPMNNADLQLALYDDLNLENFDKALTYYQTKDSRRKELIGETFERLSRK